MVAEKRTRGGERSGVRRGQIWENCGVEVRKGGRWHGRKAVIFLFEVMWGRMVRGVVSMLTLKVGKDGEGSTLGILASLGRTTVEIRLLKSLRKIVL